jgi:hypothetical protein
VRRFCCTLGLLAGLLAGCGEAPPAGTGAEAAARAYCEALVRQDWNGAHARLDAASKKALSSEQLGRLVRSRWALIGFQPVGVQVKACEEHGGEAMAHVLFRGRAGGKKRFAKDGVTLRNNGETWAVVLPPRSGEGR